MPYGSNGSTMLMLSGGIDSPVAGYLMARRGVKVTGIYFHSHPYTSERAKDKVKELAGLYNSNFRLVGMGAIDGINLVLLGALLGLIASWFSVHRHIRDIEPS